VHTEGDELGLIARLKKDFRSDDIFPVHRLDKVTSGLLVCAKTAAAASELSQLRRGAWKLCHTKNNPAITQFFSYGLGGGKRLFLLKPKTGKTHQLRVALKSLGSPIIGDRLYAHPTSLPLGIYLHAYSLSFTYQGEKYRYTVEPDTWGFGGNEGGVEERFEEGIRRDMAHGICHGLIANMRLISTCFMLVFTHKYKGKPYLQKLLHEKEHWQVLQMIVLR